MRNGYNIETLTSVDIQEIVKIAGKKIEIYEGVNWRENFKVILFKKYLMNYLNYDKNIKMKIMML